MKIIFLISQQRGNYDVDVVGIDYGSVQKF